MHALLFGKVLKLKNWGLKIENKPENDPSCTESNLVWDLILLVNLWEKKMALSSSLIQQCMILQKSLGDVSKNLFRSIYFIVIPMGEERLFFLTQISIIQAPSCKRTSCFWRELAFFALTGVTLCLSVTKSCSVLGAWISHNFSAEEVNV